MEHPGLGEGGRYHTKKGENPLPDGTTLTFALAGNQNCGKTTLFNQLTGSNQHVGNFPGVTVDRKSGAIRNNPNTEVTDLPGIYSMSPYTSEEIVTRQFIIGEKPTGIINIVDATNIERNLYLTMQLMELDTPMVLALNMMDEMRGNGGTVRINKMEAMLGIPVVPISAAKNEGVDELVDHALHVAKVSGAAGPDGFLRRGGSRRRSPPLHPRHHPPDRGSCQGRRHPGALCGHKARGGRPAHRGGPEARPERKRDDRAHHRPDGAGAGSGPRRRHRGYAVPLHPPAGGSDRREAPPEQGAAPLGQIDRFLTGRYTAIPAFVGIMALVFYLTFGVIGLALQNLLEMGIDALTAAVDSTLTAWNVNAAVHSLVIDGIFTGVGSVLSFLPIVVTLSSSSLCWRIPDTWPAWHS